MSVPVVVSIDWFSTQICQEAFPVVLLSEDNQVKFNTSIRCALHLPFTGKSFIRLDAWLLSYLYSDPVLKFVM